MNPRPSLVLPRCPICGQDPSWHYARLSTEKHGKECFIFTGCEHAQKVGGRKVLDDPKTWREVEAAWAAFFDATLAETTKHWTDVQRDAFKRRLVGKNALPGATDTMEFPPDDPAQQEQRTNEKT